MDGTARINRELLKLQLGIQNVTVYNLKADHLNSNHFYQIEIEASLQCNIAARATVLKGYATSWWYSFISEDVRIPVLN